MSLDPPPSATPPPDSEASSRTPRSRGRLLRRVALVLGLGLVLLVLFSGPLTRATVAWAASRALPWPAAHVTVESAALGPRGLRARGLQVVAEPGDTLEIDTLVVGLTPGALIRRPFHLDRLVLAGVRVRSSRGPDGWGWLTAPPRDAEAAGTAPGGGLRIDRLELRRGDLLARDAGDRRLAAESLHATLTGIEIGPVVAFQADSVAGRVDVPGWTGGWVAVDARVGIADGTARAERVELTETGGGRITVSGELGAGPERSLDLRLEGRAVPVGRLHPALGVVDTAQRADLEVTARGTAGRPALDLRVAFRDAGSLEGSSTFVVGPDTTRLRARAEVRALDLDRITAGRAAVDPVTGGLSAELTLAGGAVDGPVTLDVSSGAGTRPVRIAGSANFRAGEADLDLEAAVPGLVGRIRGPVRLTGVPGYDLEAVTRTGLPAGLLGGAVEGGESLWDIRAHLAGEGVTAEGVRARVDVRLDPVEPAGSGPVRLNLELAGGEALAATLGIDTIGSGPLAGVHGTLSATLTGRRTVVAGGLRRGPAAVEVHRIEATGLVPGRVDVSFRDMDPRAFLPSLPTGGLNGRATLQRPAQPGSEAPSAGWLGWRLTGRVQLEASTLAGRPLDGGVGLALDSGRLGFDAGLRSEDQTLRLAGSAGLGTGPAEVEVTTGRFGGIDPAAWGRGPAGRVSGTLELAYLAGPDRRGRLAVALDTGALAGRVLGPATITAWLAGDSATVSLEGVVGSIRAALEGAGGPSGAGWRGTGAVTLVEPSTADTLGLDLALARTGRDAATRVTVEGAGRIADVSLDTVSAAVDLADGTVRLDRLTVQGPALEVQGSGSIPLDRSRSGRADAVLSARTPDLNALLTRLGSEYHGRVALEYRASGPASGLRHAVRLGIGGLRGPHVEVDSVEADLAARSDSVRWLADATADVLAAGNRPVLFALGGLPYLAGFGSAGERGTAEGATGSRLDLGLAWTASDSASIRLVRMTALLDNQEWRLGDPAVLRWADGAVSLSPLELRSRTGRLAMVGRVDPGGRQDLDIEAEGLPVQVRRSGGRVALARELDLDGRLTGPGEAPRLSLDARLRDGTSAPGPSLTAEWTSEGLELSLRAGPSESAPVTVEGSVPLRLSLAPGTPVVATTDAAMAFTLTATALDLATFAPLLDPTTLREVRGEVSGRVAVTGDMAAPQVDGRLAVDGLGLQVRPLGLMLREGRLVLVAEGDRVTVEEGVLHDRRRGRIRVAGEIRLPRTDDGGVDLQVDVDGFRVADTRALDAVLSGTVTATGALDDPALRGRLRIDEGTYRLGASDAPRGLEPVVLTEADYREVEQRFGLTLAEPGAAVRVVRGIDLDLTLSAQSNFWVRRAYEPALAAELAGELRISQQPGQGLRLDGTVQVVEGRSYLEEFGRRFEIRSGQVGFAGAPSSVQLDVEAAYEPNEEVTITLGLQGDSTGFSLNLGSEPDMDETDIVSYIVLGRSSTDVDQYGELVSSDAADLGAELALSRITVGVESLARQRLGLDVVEIRQDGLRGLTLEAGRYVTRRLYLGFQQPANLAGTDETTFGIDETEVRAEYRFTRWLLANLSGSRSLARFFLGVRHAY